MKEFEFEIPKWEKYQTRKDLKSMSWFRTAGDIFFDHKFHRLSAHSKLFWIFLLSECCRANANRVLLSCQYCAKICSIRVKNVRDAVFELEQNQMLILHFRDESVPYRTEQNRTERTEQNNINAPSVALKTKKSFSSLTRNVKKKSLQNDFDSAKKFELQEPIEPSKSITKIKQHEIQQVNLLGSYYDLWRSRYGEKIARKPSDGAILKRISKVNGPEQTLRMIEAFFKMPDAWAVKKAHDLFTFEKMLSEVVRFMNSGKVFTNTAIKEADETIHYRQKNHDEDMRFIKENPHLFENRRGTLLE